LSREAAKSKETFFSRAISRAINTKFHGKFFFPRRGTGDKKGESVSITRSFQSRPITVFFNSSERGKVILPEIEIKKPSLTNFLAQYKLPVKQ